jgi:hypothetical protein
VYATEVNIKNLNLVTAPVLKFVLPLINSGAVVAREPNVADPATLRGRPAELVKLPLLGRRWTIVAASRNCCWARPRTETQRSPSPILTIASQFELSVSLVYTANPLSGDGISIDVEYIPSRILRLRSQG